MKRIYITFSGSAFHTTTAKIAEGAVKFGASELRVYDDAWLIQHPYYSLNRWIFDREPRFGFGWCAWKPLIVLEEFKRMEDGDLLLYTDADTYPISDLAPVFSFCERDDMVLFEEQGILHNRFTKRDCLLVMNSDRPEIHNAISACGRFQLFKRGPWKVQQFLYEWLTYNLNPLCQYSDFVHSPYPTSVLAPELATFYRHSAEQSILGLLALKYGVKLHRTPCQFGWPINPNCGQPEDTYPQLFIQSGERGSCHDVSGSKFRNV